jgi:GAF domain-containing protein
MKIAPMPVNEAQRLEALRLYRILDTEAEQSFDDIAALAAYVCDTPVALVGLVDKDRVWFKARVGIQPTEALRKVALCSHAILEPGLFVVPDTTQDPRFSDNPLVVHEPNIRFYAGTPLLSREGLAIGTLCVMDFQPRNLEKVQERALVTLGRAVITQLELRRRMAENDGLAQELAALRKRLPTSTVVPGDETLSS